MVVTKKLSIVSPIQDYISQLHRQFADNQEGEMAIIEKSTRPADVRADTEVSCYGLPVDEFDKLGETNTDLKTTLLVNLARILSERLRKANQEIATLGQ